VRPRQVIDVHSHEGRYPAKPWLGTDLDRLLDRALAVGVDLSIVSNMDALLDADRGWKSGNLGLLRACEKRKEALMWWVVNPRSRKSIDLFQCHVGHPKVVGIKAGPTYHHYRFSACARILFELVAKHNKALITHCGQANDMPDTMVPWANRYPGVRFIMAHFGNCGDFEGHLKALKRCVSRNCFTDTSSAVSINCQFLERGIRQLGVSRFFLGSDSPLYSIASQVARILEADLSLKEKKAVLGDNARRFLLRTA
jgi:predicted TIM-barrel fold metal-dependent hydrolase